jgi:hypothetical protein
MPLQLILVLVIVGLSGLYVGWRTWRAWSGGCGGCGCGAKKADAASQPTIVPIEHVTLRRR